MFFEAKYHTEFQELMDKSIQKRAHKKQQTPEEYEAEQEKLTRSYQALMKKWERMGRITKTKFNPEKDYLFQRAAKVANELARDILMDITVKADDYTSGTICLTTDLISLPESSSKELRIVFLSLIKSADDVLIQADAGLVKIELFYERYDPVYDDRSTLVQ